MHGALDAGRGDSNQEGRIGVSGFEAAFHDALLRTESELAPRRRSPTIRIRRACF